MEGTPVIRSNAVLPDPWDCQGEIPLNGLLERQHYPPLLTAVLVLVLAFILFQFVVSPLAIVFLLLLGGTPPGELLAALGTLMEDHVGIVLTANTVGQIFGLAIPAIVVARLHTTEWKELIRLRPADAFATGLAVLGLVAMTPIIQWSGSLNEMLPIPDFLREFEQAQMDLIETVLLGEGSVWINLIMLAVTPAICEELLFRGYIQRQAERSMGVIGGILFSGIGFGLYHLRLTQLLPLALLGLYLAYLVWRTGSLWPAVVVHFANNAFAVALSAYLATNTELDVQEVEQMQIPWYYIVGGFITFAIVVAALQRLCQEKLEHLRAARSTPEISENPIENYE